MNDRIGSTTGAAGLTHDLLTPVQRDPGMTRLLWSTGALLRQARVFLEKHPGDFRSHWLTTEVGALIPTGAAVWVYVRTLDPGIGIMALTAISFCVLWGLHGSGLLERWFFTAAARRTARGGGHLPEGDSLGAGDRTSPGCGGLILHVHPYDVTASDPDRGDPAGSTPPSPAGARHPTEPHGR